MHDDLDSYYRVGWGYCGSTGQSGSTEVFARSIRPRQIKERLAIVIVMSNNKLPFDINIFLRFIFINLKNYFTERPTVEEFQGLEKLSPATVFWFIGQLCVWPFKNEMTLKVVEAMVLFILIFYLVGYSGSTEISAINRIQRSFE